MNRFAMYLVLKYLQRTVKNFLRKMPPSMFFFNMGAYDQIFSQFLKILRKKFAIFFAKMH